VEAELDFIEFEDLLEHIEELISRVVDKVLADETMRGYMKTLNPGFQKPSRPFMRMKYADAIDWLNNQDEPILNEEGKPHVFGDDIAEAAERRMTDIINRPIFLTHFPVEIKAFYMKKDPNDLRVTESVDVLSMSTILPAERRSSTDGALCYSARRRRDRRRLHENGRLRRADRGVQEERHSPRAVLLVHRPEEVSSPSPGFGPFLR
jgi:aspartyl/asparaginyl-tRNA synthetase